jgi:hypothetical protein
MQAMRALGSSTPHGFTMVAIVLGVGLVLYQMTALVLAAPSTNQQIAIALLLPANTSDDLGLPVLDGSKLFLGTLAPQAQPPSPPVAVTYRRTAPVRGSSPGPISHPVALVVVPGDPSPTDHDGVTTPVTVPVAPQVVPMPIADGDRDHQPDSRTTVVTTAATSGTAQSRDD